jgi:hypothetical protein
MKKKNTARTVQIEKNIDRGKMYTPSKYIYDCSLSRLDTGTPIKCG